MDHDSPDDLSLIREARRGEADAFERLVDRYHRLVYRVAWGVCGNHADADDIVQSTFIKAFSGLRGFDARRASFRTWLYRITMSSAMDFLRSESRHRRHRPLDATEHPTAGHGAPDQQTAGNELAALVRQAVKGLSGQQRAIIALHEVEGLKSSEIARILDSTAESVRVQLCEARRKLSARMRPYLER